jgi:hypothetical protein
MYNYIDIYIIENISLDDFYNAWGDMDMDFEVNILLKNLCEKEEDTLIKCLEISNDNDISPKLIINYTCFIKHDLKRFKHIKKIILKLLFNMFKQHSEINNISPNIENMDIIYSNVIHLYV